MAKFQKGHPGGPGRPKLSEEQRQAKKIAKDLAGEAMDTLAYVMRSVKDDPKNAAASVKASIAIIEHAEGKPAQEMKHSGAIGSYAAQPIPVEERNPLESASRPATNGHSAPRH